MTLASQPPARYLRRGSSDVGVQGRQSTVILRADSGRRSKSQPMHSAGFKGRDAVACDLPPHKKKRPGPIRGASL